MGQRLQGCTGFVDALGDLSLLNKRDTTFVVVSRAPLAKLEAYKSEKGWNIHWFSSFGSDFNYDFHVTLDPKVAPAEYNYRTKAEMAAAMGHSVLMEGEEHGLSVFFRLDENTGGSRTLKTRPLVGLRSRRTPRTCTCMVRTLHRKVFPTSDPITNIGARSAS